MLSCRGSLYGEVSLTMLAAMIQTLNWAYAFERSDQNWVREGSPGRAAADASLRVLFSLPKHMHTCTQANLSPNSLISLSPSISLLLSQSLSGSLDLSLTHTHIHFLSLSLSLSLCLSHALTL